MGDGFHLISPPCSGYTPSLLPQCGYLFVSLVGGRIKAALGINDMGPFLHYLGIHMICLGIKVGFYGA